MSLSVAWGGVGNPLIAPNDDQVSLPRRGSTYPSCEHLSGWYGSWTVAKTYAV